MMISAIRAILVYAYGLIVALLWGDDSTYADDGGKDQ